jgi:penicillin-binding protein 1A
MAKFYRGKFPIKFNRKSRRNFFRILFFLGLFLIFVTGFLVGTFAFYSRGLPSTRTLQEMQPKQGTKVFDRHGQLIYEFAEEHRVVAPLARIPKNLIEATIAIEDRSFRSHWGVDIFGYAAAVKDFVLRRSKRLRGASTITQQLARNMFLTQDRTLSRKIAEAILAMKIERLFSKDEILELYFNQINYGHGAYGVQTASQMFFGWDVDSLTLPQAALLAGMPRGPSIYTPYTHPQAALKRRNTVLEAMVATGAITRAQADSARRTEIVVKPRELRLNDAPYFVEEVRKYLEAKYGANAIYQGAMQVYTTLDLKLQQAANQLSESWMEQLEDRYKLAPRRRDFKTPRVETDIVNTPYIQDALLALDPGNGHILAMIGGRDFLISKFNRTIQSRRQAGSAFKPFIYTAAIDNGFSPGDVILDAPIVIEDDGSGNPWYPRNYDGKFDGPTSLRRGLALSKNLIAVKLIQSIGPSTVISYARKMGIRTPLPAVLSLALGSADISMIDLVSAYGVFANRGVRVEPLMILKVLDKNGMVLEENHPYAEEVLSPQTAYIMANMMKTVVDHGTGIYARSLGFTRPAGGKTGTTNDYTDTWFVGYTPGLACGVWVGFDQKKTVAEGATGAGLALPIWAAFMKQATDSLPVRDFPVPGDIVSATICTESGLLATPACPNPRGEIFLKANLPARTCDIHRLQNLNMQSKDYNFEQLDRGSLNDPDFKP